MLKKIISGGQCGADIAGLNTAERFGLERGGMMPKGYKTLYGPKPEWAKRHNLQEHSSPAYPPRTMDNAKNSDGTMRLAFDFNSSGELLTIKAVKQYDKPDFKVDLADIYNDKYSAVAAARWIENKKIEVLNIAGNSEKTYAGTTIAVEEYLAEVFTLLGFSPLYP